MASQVLDQFECEISTSTLRFTEIYSGPLLPESMCHVPALPKLADGLEISRTKALEGAKGVMAAIGFEGCIALALYAIWQLLK